MAVNSNDQYSKLIQCLHDLHVRLKPKKTVIPTVRAPFEDLDGYTERNFGGMISPLEASRTDTPFRSAWSLLTLASESPSPAAGCVDETTFGRQTVVGPLPSETPLSFSNDFDDDVSDEYFSVDIIDDIDHDEDEINDQRSKRAPMPKSLDGTVKQAEKKARAVEEAYAAVQCQLQKFKASRNNLADPSSAKDLKVPISDEIKDLCKQLQYLDKVIHARGYQNLKLEVRRAHRMLEQIQDIDLKLLIIRRQDVAKEITKLKINLEKERKWQEYCANVTKDDLLTCSIKLKEGKATINKWEQTEPEEDSEKTLPIAEIKFAGLAKKTRFPFKSAFHKELAGMNEKDKELEAAYKAAKKNIPLYSEEMWRLHLGYPQIDLVGIDIPRELTTIKEQRSYLKFKIASFQVEKRDLEKQRDALEKLRRKLANKCKLIGTVKKEEVQKDRDTLMMERKILLEMERQMRERASRPYKKPEQILTMEGGVLPKLSKKKDKSLYPNDLTFKQRVLAFQLIRYEVYRSKKKDWKCI